MTHTDYTQTFDLTGQKELFFGQGRRAGCFPIGPEGRTADELIIGVLKLGQKCPKHP